MKIIAIDSSSLTASVAIIEDEQILAEYNINYKKTHSQTLLPMLDEIKKMTELDLDTIDAIAISKGPGSFTGLRIGSATAKGLGLALKKPIIPIGTLEGLSYNAWGISGLICPIMDARRNQVYTAIYKFENGEHITVIDQCAISIEEIVEKINELGEKVLFMGDGVPVHQDYIKNNIKTGYQFAPAHMSRQRAAAFAIPAKKYLEEGRIEAAEDHKPEYLRLSQAERERLEREESKKEI